MFVDVPCSFFNDFYLMRFNWGNKINKCRKSWGKNLSFQSQFIWEENEHPGHHEILLTLFKHTNKTKLQLVNLPNVSLKRASLNRSTLLYPSTQFPPPRVLYKLPIHYLVYLKGHCCHLFHFRDSGRSQFEDMPIETP